ncbi:MAG: DUF222 domain-containing protein [Actinomycetota bacterium]
MLIAENDDETEDDDETTVVSMSEHHQRLRDRRRRMQSFEAELDEVAGFLNGQTGRLVDLTRVLLDDPNEWGGPGLETAEKYLAWRMGVSPARARRLVTIAERADELPVTLQALRDGELSEDQVHAIAVRAPGWADEQAAGFARRMTVVQLQRTMRAYPFHAHATDAERAAADVDRDAADRAASDETSDAGPDGARSEDTRPEDAGPEDAGRDGAGPDGSGPDGARAGTGDRVAGDESATADVAHPADEHVASIGPDDVCWYGQTDDGRWRLHVETDRAAGSLIELVLDERRDRIFHETGRPADGVQALLALCDQSVDATPAARRERTRIGVFIDLDEHHGDRSGSGDGVAVDGDVRTSDRPSIADRLHSVLPDHVADQLCCGGVISPILVEQGRPISVGRGQRIVPERTRRIVEYQDQGCRVPGCTAQHHLEIHHIVHWRDGGPTDTWNLVALCGHHHRLHHRERLGISGDADDADGLEFTDASGRPIAHAGAAPRPPGGPPPPISGTWRHPLGERLESAWLSFFRAGVDDVRWRDGA